MSKKKDLLIKLLENGNKVKIEEICHFLKFDFETLRMCIEELTGLGIKIELNEDFGLVLLKHDDEYDEKLISALFPYKNYHLHVFDTISSSNSYVLSNVAILSDKDVVLAKTQNAGIGRNGRSFFSYDGGLYFSVLYKFYDSDLNFDLTFFTAASAIAVAWSIKKYVKKSVKIKWVNDIYVDGKKVCGILAQAKSDSKSIAYCLGIGINVKERDFSCFDFDATYLGNNVNKLTLLAEILTNLDLVLAMKKEDIVKEYKKLSLVKWKRVLLHDLASGDTKKAFAFNVDRNLKLVVLDNGKIRRITNKEIKIKVQR